MSVYLCSFHCDEQMTVLYLTAVNVHAFNLNVCIAVDSNCLDVFE